MNRKFGTREWAEVNKNIYTGCEHNCRYCYARYNAISRFKRVKNKKEWGHPVFNEKAFNETPKKYNGRIMYPTQHDITPSSIDVHIKYLKKWLQIGNDILIVSKPHFDCVKMMCDELEAYKKQIVFRFTIGSPNNDVLKFWEPDAPDYTERVSALQYAFTKGFTTSVSCEPILDEDISLMVHELLPFIQDSIWLGKMNSINQRVDKVGWKTADYNHLDRVLKASTNSFIFDLYDDWKDNPQVKWKESIKEVIGLPDEPTG